MTSRVIAIITCERCGQIGQTTAQWRTHEMDDSEDGRYSGRYEAERPDAWRGYVRYGERRFQIGVNEIVPDTENLTGESHIVKIIDLCPTCRMSFLTWWLEGKR